MIWNLALEASLEGDPADCFETGTDWIFLKEDRHVPTIRTGRKSEISV